jgi:glycosyltransferase involved in cell wall biosynthesis
MEPLVSVCIWTYNQENYIRACVEGALKQRTTFKIEVIVGNDCSPDGTQAILDELAVEYPDRLVAINRPQNIGGHKNSMDVIARARGEFIALCDGDDYWIDPLKLQKQYDALQRHPNVDLCFHPAKEYRNEKLHRVICDHYDNETIVPLKQVIEGGGGFMPTASLMIRKSAVYPFPGWFVESAPVGDLFLQILGAVRGGACFLRRPMSAYCRSDSSYSQSMVRPSYALHRESKIGLWLASFSGLANRVEGHDEELSFSLSVNLAQELNQIIVHGSMTEYSVAFLQVRHLASFGASKRVIYSLCGSSRLAFFLTCASLRAKRWLASKALAL